jgi:peptidoglycan/xylan/chitin deacetylase (PgdA/CDA1 family)
VTAPALVALTFDDGPSSFRPRTLEVLRELRVPAVFFDVGVRVRANPHLVRFAALEGHQVLNHTSTHPPLTELPDEAVRREVLDAAQALTDAGITTAFAGLRPPFLAVDDRVRGLLAELGHVEVGATIGTRDYLPATGPEEIRDEVLAHLAPGAVIVLHDGAVDSAAGAATVAALPEIVAGARERGYEFGLLDATGAVVPATYASSGEPVPELAAPVPYRPLAVSTPEPPEPWVPIA